MNYIWILFVITSFKAYAVSYSIIDKHSNEKYLGVISRYRRQEPCPLNRWPCGGDTNQCIDNYEVCDGKINCRNRADETESVCRNIRCAPYTHRCAYGACVSSDVRCDGTQDCADGSDETLPECNTHGQPISNKPTGCKRSEFQCKSGQCISRTLTCDGAADCADASDETSEECSSAQCYPYVYRCEYGACVPMSSRCNGIKECYDGSDEDPRICGNISPTNRPVYEITTTTDRFVWSEEGGCNVPNMENVIVLDAKTNQPLSRNKHVPIYTVVKYQCDHSLHNSGQTLGTCLENGWNGLPTCTNSCKIKQTSQTYDLECSMNGKVFDCSTEVPVGATVRSICKKEYKLQSTYNEMVCLDNGQFDLSLTPCIPECGLPVPRGVVYVINGLSAQSGDFPWHAAIFRRLGSSEPEQICGGSIVNAITIISAAHCFYYYENGEERKYGKEIFSTGVGKLIRKYSANEPQAQFSRLTDLIIHDSYNGVQGNYANDIAILRLETKITFGKYVRPVCVEWKSTSSNDQFQGTGIVAGWGLTAEHGTPSTGLQWISLPTVTREECKNQSPHDFQQFIVEDKFCAGYLNGSSVCQGDSGGGLSFPIKELSKTLYYLKGIVSVGPNSNGTCNSHKYTAFTSIRKHLEWLRNNRAQFGLL